MGFGDYEDEEMPVGSGRDGGADDEHADADRDGGADADGDGEHADGDGDADDEHADGDPFGCRTDGCRTAAYDDGTTTYSR